MAANLKKDLQVVNRELKALSKKVEKLVAVIGKTEKPKAVKKTVAKKEVKVTAIDTVLNIVTRSKKGIDVAGLKKKTGYDAPKIYRAVKALKKKGKIKTVRMGVYVKV